MNQPKEKAILVRKHGDWFLVAYNQYNMKLGLVFALTIFVLLSSQVECRSGGRRMGKHRGRMGNSISTFGRGAMMFFNDWYNGVGEAVPTTSK